MIFTNQELGAIFRLGHAMAIADGKITDEETKMIVLEMCRFGVDVEKGKLIAKIGDEMSYGECCKIISNMTAEEKKYVTAFLGTLICADGNVDDSEMKLWSLISALCDLPTMTIMDALQIMSNL